MLECYEVLGKMLGISYNKIKVYVNPNILTLKLHIFPPEHFFGARLKNTHFPRQTYISGVLNVRMLGLLQLIEKQRLLPNILPNSSLTS